VISPNTVPEEMAGSVTGHDWAGVGAKSQSLGRLAVLPRGGIRVDEESFT